MPSDRQAADLVIATGPDNGAVARRPIAARAQVAAAVERVAEARRGLAEAGTIPDVRQVMEAATVAADAARRVARLAEGQGTAAELVEAANQAANDAAALRIEAQARAGVLLEEMQDRGELAVRGQHRHVAGCDMSDLGISRSDASRWRQVAAVPVDVRRQYVEETNALGGEVTTAGLLRHAGQREPEVGVDPIAVHVEARRQIRRVYRGLRQLPGYEPRALVAALDEGERQDLVATLTGLEAWVADVRGELAIYRPASEEA
jgi:hypothetical protein